MLERIDDLVANRESFAFESTLAGRTVAQRIKWFRAKGYAVRISYLWLDDPDLAVRRVKQRARTGGHDVPEPDVRRHRRLGIPLLVSEDGEIVEVDPDEVELPEQEDSPPDRAT